MKIISRLIDLRENEDILVHTKCINTKLEAEYTKYVFKHIHINNLWNFHFLTRMCKRDYIGFNVVSKPVELEWWDWS